MGNSKKNASKYDLPYENGGSTVMHLVKAVATKNKTS